MIFFNQSQLLFFFRGMPGAGYGKACPGFLREGTVRFFFLGGGGRGGEFWYFFPKSCDVQEKFHILKIQVLRPQPRSQGLSSLPPLVVGRKTLVAAGHMTTQNLGGKKICWVGGVAEYFVWLM